MNARTSVPVSQPKRKYGADKEIAGNNPLGEKTTRSAVRPYALVGRSEEKIITRAKAPVEGKQFHAVADQDAYLREILSQ